jgi:chromosome segregation ATPase
VAEAAALRRRVAALEAELAESARKERVWLERAQTAREDAEAALAERDSVLRAVESGDGARAATEAAMAEIVALREEVGAMQDEIDAAVDREAAAISRAVQAEAGAEAARRLSDEAVHGCDRRVEDADRRMRSQGGGGAEYEEQYAELAVRLVDAKLAAAQYAYERDEARQKHGKARAAGNRVAEQLTTMEV